ncbi:MAG: tetratricopeptide repeat protein [Desulfobaccales bacterium]|nr:tetratricopeptide repeat protein [Desulfobaccales bacterium]
MKRLSLLVTVALVVVVLSSGLTAAQNVQTLIDQGVENCEKGRYDQAIQEFNQALKLKPNEASILDCLGVAHYAKGQNDRAIQYFTQAIKADPKYTRSYMRRANVYDTMGEYDKALADLEQAKSLGHKVDSDFIKLIERKKAAKRR